MGCGRSQHRSGGGRGWGKIRLSREPDFVGNCVEGSLLVQNSYRGTNHNQVSGKDSFFATFAKIKIMSKRGMYDINILNKCLKEVSIT